jgi:Tfp pilus assembly protein PilO
VTTRAPLFGVLAAVLLGAGFWFLLYSPAGEELAAVHEETAALEAQRSSLQNEIAMLRDIEANEMAIRASLAKIEEYVPSGTAQSQAVRQFQETADAAGVEIVSVTFGAPETVADAPPVGDPGLGLARLPVSMTVSGGYFQVVDLFRRLEVDVPRAVLLMTTWDGQLFAVVPLIAAPPPPPPVEGEAPAEGAPAEGEAPAEATTASGETVS